MDITEQLTKERLGYELTSPGFLGAVSEVVDTSIKEGLVGMFGLYFSCEDNLFYPSDVVSYYKESDLESGELDYERPNQLEGHKQTRLWPGFSKRGNIEEDDLIAQVYTITNDFREPCVRTYNLLDLGIARLAAKGMQRLFNKSGPVFRPFGIVVDKYELQNQDPELVFSFYSESTETPSAQTATIDDYKRISESMDPTSQVALLEALFQKKAEPKTHSFNTAFFNYREGRFEGEIDSETLDDIVKWD